MDVCDSENVLEEAMFTPERLTYMTERRRLEQLLRDSERKLAERVGQLEAIFEAMVDGVIVFDGQGYLLHMNTAARDLLGQDTQPNYFLHLAHERPSPYEVRDEQGQPLFVEQWPLLRVMRGEVLTGATAVDVIIRTRDGREIQLNVSGAPVRDQDGRIDGAVMVMRDVTERRRQEQHAKEALHALLAMAQLAVQGPEEAKISVDETASQAEPAAQEIAQSLAELALRVLGCQRLSITTIEPEMEILRPLAIVGLSPEQERQWWAEQRQNESRLADALDPLFVQRLRANEVVLLDLAKPPWNALPNPYGIRTVLVTPMSIREHLVGFLSLDYGGAEHIYTSEELALAEAVAKLTALVIERGRLVQERAEAQAREIALRETKGQMDEFLGIASHELRTPLTTIKGNIQLAKLRLTHYMHSLSLGDDEIQENLTEIQTMLDRAERQVNVQNRLVSDLLDISRIEVDKLELRKEPCDLAAIVLETVEDLRSANLTRPIHLELAQYEMVPIFADAERIGQVVSNYLTNALKYSPADSPVEVRLKKEGKLAYVSVRDEGPGLTLSEQERIWERFYRAQGVERQRGFSLGLGLGLHICRAIIEQHEGNVGVESTKGVGSTFWFTLPLAEPNEQAAG